METLPLPLHLLLTQTIKIRPLRYGNLLFVINTMIWRYIKIRPLRYGNKRIIELTKIPKIKIRPLRYGNRLWGILVLYIYRIKIRPLRYGNRNPHKYIAKSLLFKLKSDRCGMETIYTFRIAFHILTY